MKFCMVTGGAGFIGSHLVEKLVQKGCKIRVLDNFSTGKLSFLKKFGSDIEILEGDIRNYNDCRKAVKGVDIIYHLAALKSVPKSLKYPSETHATNATGTLNLLHASLKSKVRRFIYASSSSVYGTPPSFPTKENSPTKPMSPYGVSKLAGENYCFSYFLNYGLETVVLRYFNVFGPRQDPNSIYAAAVPIFIKHLSKNISPVIYGNGRQTRDFTYVENVVQANLLAAEVLEAKGQVFNVASGKDRSVLNLFKTLHQLMKKRNITPLFQPKRKFDPDRSFADISKAKRILGWVPEITFEEGARRTVEWFV